MFLGLKHWTLSRKDIALRSGRVLHYQREGAQFGTRRREASEESARGVKTKGMSEWNGNIEGSGVNEK